ncbi:MAG TPA: MFS transporter [Rhodocyclaceae bacterium]|nr:MFS transporter [Rhodocyclaceae bacterium]
MLRALGSRNYRRYFAGQLVSLAGTWMQQIAMTWLAYRLTGSALILGTVGFASQLPVLIFGSLGGVWSDRFDKRRLLLWTQSLAMGQAILLALLTWNEMVSPPLLVLLAFVLGCVNALDIPARQAFVVQLVDDREHLPNAIALNSFLMNSARFVGPALAGFIVATVGEAVCFLLNALSYLAVLVALLGIDTPPKTGEPSPALQALKDGYAYVFGHRDIRGFLLVVASVSFLVTPYAVMMPLFSSVIFRGDARTYGLLIGSAGAGSLLAGLYLASRKDTVALAQRTGLAVIAAGAALALFAVNRALVLAFPIVMALGFFVLLAVAGSNTLIQIRVDDAYRGRVMAIFSMAFLGIAPLGSFAVGSLAHVVGVPPTLLGCGLATVVIGLAVRRHTAPPPPAPPA